MPLLLLLLLLVVVVVVLVVLVVLLGVRERGVASCWICFCCMLATT